MSRYSDQIRDEYGRLIPGVSIYVYKWDAYAQVAGDLETLTDDLSAPLANPLTSDPDGLYYFNSADGQKLLEYHYGGKVQERSLILVGKLPVPQAVFGGLFTNASALVIPTGMDMIGTTGYASLGIGAANYIADNAVDAAYVAANPRSSFISANSRGFRLDHEQDITPEMLGAVADGTTSDNAAVVAATANLAARALTGQGYGSGTPPLNIPASPALYAMGATPLDLNFTMRIRGDGVGVAGGWSSALKWSAGSHGCRIQYYNTTADTAIGGGLHGGTGSIIEGLVVQGGYAGTEGEFHGYFSRTQVSLRDVQAWDWQGDGAHFHAATGLPESGNANAWEIRKAWFQNVRNGVFADGSDVNQGIVYGVNVSGARQWGFYDNGGIQNLYISPLTQLCGYNSDNDGTAGKPVSVVSRGGQRYAVIAGQENGASTNPPPSATVTITIASPGVVTWTAHGLAAGTAVAFSTTGALPTGLTANTTYYVVSPAANTFSVAATVGGAAINTSGSQSGVHTSGAAADNTWWYWYAVGGVEGFHPAWFSGIALRAGGPFYMPGATILHPYAESEQPPCQFGGGVLRIGGTLGNRVIGGAHISASSHQVCLNDLRVTANNISGDDDQMGAWTIGRYNAGTGCAFIKPTPLCSYLAINSPNNTQMLQVADAGITVAGDINLGSGKVYKVNSVQVLGARQTGWTADTGTAKKTANATYAAGTTLTYSATYVQAEQTAMATRLAAVEAALQDASQTIKALKDALIAHGAVGT